MYALIKLFKEDIAKKAKKDEEILSHLDKIREKQDEMEQDTVVSKKYIIETLTKIHSEKDVIENLEEKEEDVKKEIDECEKQKQKNIVFFRGGPRRTETLCWGHGWQTVECCRAYQATR